MNLTCYNTTILRLNFEIQKQEKHYSHKLFELNCTFLNDLKEINIDIRL